MFGPDYSCFCFTCDENMEERLGEWMSRGETWKLCFDV